MRANAGESSDGIDRLKVDVCDPYWLRVRWRLSQSMLDRAEVALGAGWHQAVPVLRVYDVTSEAAHVRVADVKIHGETETWFVPVDGPPRSYRLQIGYLAPDGTFFSLASSNVVATPCPNTLAVKDGNGKCSRDHASNGNGASRVSHNHRGQSKSRPENATTGKSCPITSFDVGGSDLAHLLVDFPLEARAELVVSGKTHPQARLSLMGNDVALDKNGEFAFRLALPNGRQVISVAAVSPGGEAQRTVVMGIECNTKELEPQNLTDPLY